MSTKAQKQLTEHLGATLQEISKVVKGAGVTKAQAAKIQAEIAPLFESLLLRLPEPREITWLGYEGWAGMELVAIITVRVEPAETYFVGSLFLGTVAQHFRGKPGEPLDSLKAVISRHWLTQTLVNA